MYEKCLPRIQEPVCANRNLGEAERKYWQQGATPCYKLIHRMDSGCGKPVELLSAVMDCVESPQPWHRMKHAVGEIDADIGNTDAPRGLDPISWTSNSFPHPNWYQPARCHCYADKQHAKEKRENVSVEQPKNNIPQESPPKNWLRT